MACILLWGSAVRVHDSRAYRKLDATGERTSRIFELREMLLSSQTGLNLINAAVVCAVLESISGLEPSSVITEPRYFKLVSVLLKYSVLKLSTQIDTNLSFDNVFKTTNETCLQWFQYRLLYRLHPPVTFCT